MDCLKSFKKVAVGLSGGVDSAVAALLIKLKGFHVTGVFMKNWDLTDETGFCTTSKDLEDAKYICHKLSFPFFEVNFVKEYWNSVFTEMLDDYENGLTPNPDVLCNKFIKFKAFSDFALKVLGADAIATGHYARNSFGQFLQNAQPEKNARLITARDEIKDQTFFLSQIPQQALRKTMFPLGDMLKSDVRRLARKHGLHSVADKKESMGICFIGSRKFDQFISEYVKPSHGIFIDIDSGRSIGQHSGKHNWTIGQRCRISGMSEPYYIVKKTESQDIYVAKGHFHPSLYSSTLTTNRPYWIDSEPLELVKNSIFKCQFRFQHSKPLTDCNLLKVSDGQLWIKLEKPLRALTPGQYAVFYKNSECLGSARILSPGPSMHMLHYIRA